jgi:hypothetical protein
VENDTARRPQLQRIVQIGDRDLVVAFVVIGRAAQIVDHPVRLEPDRFRGVSDDLGVIAFLFQPTARQK